MTLMLDGISVSGVFHSVREDFGTGQTQWTIAVIPKILGNVYIQTTQAHCVIPTEGTARSAQARFCATVGVFSADGWI